MRTAFTSIVIALCFLTTASAQSVSAEAMQRLVARETSGTFASAPALNASSSGTPTNADFFSRFIMALETLTSGKGEALTFDWNFATDFSPDHAGKFQVVLRKPDLSAPLITELGTNEAALGEFRGQLSYSDDVTYTVSIAPRANTMTNLMAQAVPAIAPAVAQRLLGARVGPDAVRMAQAEPGSALESVQQSEMLRMLEPVAERAALVAASQSKWHFDASYRKRRDLAGPNEVVLKASYEHGTDPLALMTKALRTDCATALTRFRETPQRDAGRQALFSAANCEGDLLNAVQTVSETSAVDRQLRYVFTIDAHWTQGQDIVRSAPPVNLNVLAKSGRSIAATAAIGWDVYRPEKVDKRGRLELSATYDDVSGDPDRDDRFIGKLTYSQRITEGVHAPVSLVYASKADYLTNVDRRLNAHFGIAFKIPSMP